MTCMNLLRRSVRINLLAIVAILLPAFIQFAQAMPIGSGSDEAEDGWRYAVICTTYGVVKRPLTSASQSNAQDQSQSQNAPNSKNSGTSCPVCLSFSIANNSLAPEGFHFSALRQNVQGVAFFEQHELTFSQVETANQTRAPPFKLDC